MKYRRLGRAGPSISEIGHGLWGIGAWSGSTDLENEAALHASIALGCTFFDSAFAYGNGHSDVILGRTLAQYGSTPFVVASKVPPKNWKWPGSSVDNPRDVFPKAHIVDYANRISDHMGGRKIDLLLLHVWDDSWSGDDDWKEAALELKATGVISQFGISLNRWEPENGLHAIETGLIDAVQVIYNIFDQAPEDTLFPLCRDRGIGVVARVPLDEGSLGGGLTLQTTFPPDDWRAKYFGPENLPETVQRVESLKTRYPQSSLAQLALRFVLSHSDVSSCIVGMRKAAHVRENLKVSELGPLSADEILSLRDHRWDRRVADWSN